VTCGPGLAVTRLVQPLRTRFRLPQVAESLHSPTERLKTPSFSALRPTEIGAACIPSLWVLGYAGRPSAAFRSPTSVGTTEVVKRMPHNHDAAHERRSTARCQVSAAPLNPPRRHAQRSLRRARRVIRPNCEARLTTRFCALAAAGTSCCVGSLARTLELCASRLSSTVSFYSRCTRPCQGAPAPVTPLACLDRPATPCAPHTATEDLY